MFPPFFGQGKARMLSRNAIFVPRPRSRKGVWRSRHNGVVMISSARGTHPPGGGWNERGKRNSVVHAVVISNPHPRRDPSHVRRLVHCRTGGQRCVNYFIYFFHRNFTGIFIHKLLTISKNTSSEELGGVPASSSSPPQCKQALGRGERECGSCSYYMLNTKLIGPRS
jgi:hypothetical protein